MKPTKKDILKAFLSVANGDSSIDMALEIYSENINSIGHVFKGNMQKGYRQFLSGETISELADKGFVLSDEEKEGIKLLAVDYVSNRGLVWLNMYYVSNNLSDKKLSLDDCYNLDQRDL